MQDLQGFYAALAVLASALGCGLLMGIERERRKGSGPHRALAGVRSFALASLSGAAAALSGSVALLGAGAAFVAALGVVAYARDRVWARCVAPAAAALHARRLGARTFTAWRNATWHARVVRAVRVGGGGESGDVTTPHLRPRYSPAEPLPPELAEAVAAYMPPPRQWLADGE